MWKVPEDADTGTIRPVHELPAWCERFVASEWDLPSHRIMLVDHAFYRFWDHCNNTNVCSMRRNIQTNHRPRFGRELQGDVAEEAEHYWAVERVQAERRKEVHELVNPQLKKQNFRVHGTIWITHEERMRGEFLWVVCYSLPYYTVLKSVSTKTKLREVFDSSCKALFGQFVQNGMMVRRVV